jgi:hypothetical protein
MERLRPASAGAAMGAAALLTGCLGFTAEDWQNVEAANYVEAQCPSCNWEQRQVLFDRYISQRYPHRAIERAQQEAASRDADLRSRRTSFSSPATYRCRINNPRTNITSTSDLKIENGEWYYAPANGAFTAGRCNRAFVENGYRVEIQCTLRDDRYVRSISYRTITNIGGDMHTIDTFYPYTLEYVAEAYTSSDSLNGTRRGSCERLP